MSDFIAVVTVDGPGGAGKGTLCRRLAEVLGFNLLDSGALYRVLALAAQHHGVALDQEPALAALASHLDVSFDNTANGVEVILEGEVVTQSLRLETTGMAASKVAAFPQVREALLRRQRAFRQLPGLVADGRDMGTVVFPDAPVKLFLDASAEERARRRFEQLRAQGVGASISDLLAEIIERDDRDRNRAVAPLKAADDAYVIDSTSMSIDEVVELALSITRQKLHFEQ